MLSISTKKNENANILFITGELTIETSAELKSALVRALENAKTVVVDLENVTAADLSCLQLLYSAYATAADSDKCFTLGGKCPEVFKEAANDAGYSSNAKCGLNCDKGCIWIMNGNDEQ